MSRRKPGYVIGVILLAVLLSAPQVIIGGGLGCLWYWQGSYPLPLLPGFGNNGFLINQYAGVSCWQDQLVHFNLNEEGKASCQITMKDPETGADKKLDLNLPEGEPCQVILIGDHMWLTGKNETYEVVDSALVKYPVHMPRPDTTQPPQWFFCKIPTDQQDSNFSSNAGEVAVPAYLERTKSGYVVKAFRNGAWNTLGDLRLPIGGQVQSVGSKSSKSGSTRMRIAKSAIQVFNSGDDVHLFLHNDGYVLYRKGLEFEPNEKAISIPTVVSDSTDDETVKTVSMTHTSDTEIADIVNNPEWKGWSLVCDQPLDDFNGVMRCTHGLVVDGMPAAVIVEGTLSGNPIGHFYRFDGQAWSEWTTLSFPFGSTSFRTLSSQDGQKSYLIATTTTQTMHLYAVEATGFRKIIGLDRWENSASIGLFFYVTILAATSILGAILSAGVWILMGWCQKPDYEFGVQTVKLASVGWRAIARTIDVTLIGVSIIGIGAFLTRSFDWLSLAEALNLGVNHPTLTGAVQIVSTLAFCLAAMISVLLVTQAKWGVTPGKWLCRLRTVRTSLRPCGFARSLAREIVFFVDCGNFICWTPGILSIALTDHRQRLGDLVADTIVVEKQAVEKIG
ncbi:MAG: RDD family protein [Schlesneria sp.]